MFGVGTYQPAPKALKAMLALLESEIPDTPVHPEVPGSYPAKFIVVQKTGGITTANERIIVPEFAIQCYTNSISNSETLAGLVVSVLKSAQFTVHGGVQFRKFSATEPVPFNNPLVQGKQRWQFTCTFAMSTT